MYEIAFWASIVFTIIGAGLGLLGIWVKEFWRSDTGSQLILTDVLLAVTSVIVALLTKWLGN